MSSLALKLFTILGNSGAAPAQLYDARVLATNPLRYNKLNETSGTAIVDSSGNAYTGTYSGVTLNSAASPFAPNFAPLWDGVNDYGNLYSAAFGTAFNLDEGCMIIWAKVSAAGVWTDAANRRIVEIARDSNNRVFAFKSSSNNNITVQRIGNTNVKSVSITISTSDWFSLMLSWSVAGDYFKAYVNGVQQGATQTGLLASAGSGLLSTQTVIGSLSTTPSQIWSGYLANLIAFSSVENAARIALGVA